jgi:hypothetical protein
MMEMEQISETSVFYSTLKRLIDGEDFSRGVLAFHVGKYDNYHF